MKTYPLTLSPTYCSSWGVQEGLREILQNALDQGDWYVDYNEDKLTITNRDSQIPPEFLLLGGGNKGGSSRGGHCEGLKIALLILCREGHPVTIRNGNVLWEAYYEQSDLFNGEYILHIDETPLKCNSDVEVLIQNISEDDYQEFVERSLPLQDVEYLKETSKGSILMDSSGKLYCGGLFVCDTGLEYSYDMQPSHLVLDRDRQTPKSFDLKYLMSSIWSSTSKSDLEEDSFVDLIVEGKRDIELVSSYEVSDSIRVACHNKIKEKYSDKVVIASSEHNKEVLQSKGYKDVKVVTNTKLLEIVQSSSSYREHLKSISEDLAEEVSVTEVLCKVYSKMDYIDEVEECKALIGELMDLFEYKGCYFDTSVYTTDLDFIKEE